MRQTDYTRLPLFADSDGRFSFAILRFAWQIQQQASHSVEVQFREPSQRLRVVGITPPVAKPVAQH